MPPHSRGQDESEHPGAGTLFVESALPSNTASRRGRGRNSLNNSRSRSRTPIRFRPSSSSRDRDKKEQVKWPPVWDEIVGERKQEPVIRLLSGADSLLERGIGDYTFLPAPEGLLGKGKFSTVYKVTCPEGKQYALKHTPLHPHHPLIAARLLREPTLLAQLPPHPCLVGVEGWIRTEGHFYLIEQYAASHTPLQNHPLPLRPSRAAYILDQLVSVIRDCMHRGRVCHRDLKGENILVDIETGDIVVLDLGLATQFSASEPKLTTCCGSPAFHSPEIVNALNHPPGAVTYFGPELDIWCIALTLLALLSSSRFPLGPSHRSRHTMASRVRDRLQELDQAYPPYRPAVNWALTAAEHEFEAKEWQRVRVGLAGFLEMDGVKRMEHFKRYKFGDKYKSRLLEWGLTQGTEETGEIKDKDQGGFKQLTFVGTKVKYTLPLFLLPPTDLMGYSRTEPVGQYYDMPATIPTSIPTLTLGNPTYESERRVLSYIKYLLRTHGILYHCISGSSGPLLQLVVRLPPTSDPISLNTETEKTSTPWLSSLFRRSRSSARSTSVPPKQDLQSAPAEVDPAKIPKSYIQCYAQIEFTYPPRPSQTRTNSKSSVSQIIKTPRRRRSLTVSGISGSDVRESTRSSSLAPAYLSSPRMIGTVSPPPQTETGLGGESLAVASLQQALMRIVSASPTEMEGNEGLGKRDRWVQSDTATNGLCGNQDNSENKISAPTSETVTGTNTLQLDYSGDSGDTSPNISTPTTPGSATPLATPRRDIKPSKPRPQFQRAASSPRMTTSYTATSAVPPTPYRGLPPVSPSIILSPLPGGFMGAMPLSPLSRQVSLKSSTTSSTQGNTHETTTRPTGTVPPPIRAHRGTSSRPSSRLNSRAPSRAPSYTSSNTAALSRELRSRTQSTISSPSTSSSTKHSPNSSQPQSQISSLVEAEPEELGVIPKVIIKLSDSRVLEIIKKALDVPHDHPIPHPLARAGGTSSSSSSVRHHDVQKMTRDMNEKKDVLGGEVGSQAVQVPRRISRSRSSYLGTQRSSKGDIQPLTEEHYQEQEEEANVAEEEEAEAERGRGRPRSREDSKTLSLRSGNSTTQLTTIISTGSSSTATGSSEPPAIPSSSGSSSRGIGVGLGLNVSGTNIPGGRSKGGGSSEGVEVVPVRPTHQDQATIDEMKHDKADDRKKREKRETSAGRKILDLLGLAGAGVVLVGDKMEGERYRRRGMGMRTSSAPPRFVD